QLNAANTYAGGTQIYNTVRLAASERLPNSSAVNVDALGTLDVDQWNETVASASLNGRLRAQIAGAANPLIGQFRTTGLMSLEGTLQIATANGLTLPLGATFDILDWGTLSGSFSTIQLPTLANNLSWSISRLYSTGVISVVHAGDFDGNGNIDAGDYVAWRKWLPTGAYSQS